MMRNRNLFFVTLFLLISFVPGIKGADVNEMMTMANNYYQNSQFEQAITIYEQILDESYVSPALYYNLGNAYYRNGYLGKSILCYERALKLSPNDEDVKYNLKIVNARSIDQITEVPQIFIIEWWDILVTSFSLRGWLIVVSVFYLLTIIFIGFYLLFRKGNVKRFSFIFGSFNLIVSIFCVVLMLANYNKEHTSDYGILLIVVSLH